MEIREMRSQDTESISHLYVSVFSNPPWNETWQYDWAYERLNWVYRAQGFRRFVTVESDRLIGAILGHDVPFKGKKEFQIVEFFVDSDRQNKGIGTNLLLELKLELRENNCDFTFLLTSKDTSIESFYLKRNYERDNKLVLLRQKI